MRRWYGSVKEQLYAREICFVKEKALAASSMSAAYPSCPFPSSQPNSTHLFNGTLINTSTLVDKMTGSGGLSAVVMKGGREESEMTMSKEEEEVERRRREDTYESTSVCGNE